MALIVGALPNSRWQRLTPLLEAMEWDGSQSEDVEHWYTEPSTGALNGDDLYVLVHDRPEYCIAKALDESRDLNSAVSAWQASSEALLAVFKKNRARAVLLDVGTVCESPKQALQWLSSNHSGFDSLAKNARERDLRLGAVQDGQDLDGSLNLLVATQAVAQSKDIKTLVSYYEAASVPVEGVNHGTPLIDLMSTLSRITELKEENDLVVKELFKVQEELERYCLSDREKASDIERLTSELKVADDKAEEAARTFQKEITEYEKRVAEDENRITELKEENDLVIKELFKVQEELERYYLADKKKATDIERLTSELKVAEENYRTLSKDKESEIAGLKSRLEYTSSEMTKFSHDKQQEIVLIRNSLRDKERDLVKKDQQLESLERKYNEVNQAFLRVQNSLFWRLTFPLRWFLSRVKKVGSLFGRRAIRKQAKLVRESDLFDAEWYLAKYPDIAESGAKPDEHYVRFGASEGRDPGPYFSSKNYLQANPDVAKAGLNPLAHYIQHGKSEGRRLT